MPAQRETDIALVSTDGFPRRLVRICVGHGSDSSMSKHFTRLRAGLLLLREKNYFRSAIPQVSRARVPSCNLARLGRQ